MSGRFVRSSKFRHVHGEPPKLEQCFQELRPQTAGESNLIAANKKYFAIGLTGGGGPMLVHPLNLPMRFPAKFPEVNVHKGKILDIDFNPFYDQLVGAASDDGTASIVRIPEGGLEDSIRDPLVTLFGHEKRVGVIKFHPTADNIVATGAYDNTVKIWDVSTQAEVSSYNAHEDFVQCISWNVNGSQMITTSKDKNLRLLDPRQSEAAVTVAGHQGGKGSRAVYMDNHNKMCVTGFTRTAVRTIVIYDPRNMEAKLCELEIDQSAGLLMPFYDEDTSVLYISGKGDGNIRYYEVIDEEEPLYSLAEFRSNTPHKGICFAPKAACNYMECEVAFCLRLQKSVVEPIHFIVPRKSNDLFQSDLYPDTYAGVPALSAEEWIAGENRDPVRASIQEAAAQQAVSSNIVIRKSPAELEKELAEAHERIRLLEEEVARLRGA